MSLVFLWIRRSSSVRSFSDSQGPFPLPQWCRSLAWTRNLRPFRFPGRWRTLSPTQTRIQSPLHHKVNGSCQSQGRYRFRFRDRSPVARDNPSRRGGTLLFRFPFPGPGKGSVRTSCMGLVFCFLLFCPVSGISGPSFPKCPAGNPAGILCLLC